MFSARMFAPHHLMFPFLNGFYLGKQEQDLKANITRFKDFLLRLIIKRKEDLRDPNFNKKGDFVTLMLEDELYSGNN
jgi:hypothetical protein